MDGGGSVDQKVRPAKGINEIALRAGHGRYILKEKRLARTSDVTVAEDRGQVSFTILAQGTHCSEQKTPGAVSRVCPLELVGWK